MQDQITEIKTQMETELKSTVKDYPAVTLTQQFPKYLLKA